ncbi:DUF362 domain-containing protein [Oceanidesulfovibrio marinus]|uniref:DUF362 domain-containing protein n=1 Tax=Oceanidesulfovibrio marinus TaxID=370038 RepID=A0A6P1ZGR5_9BACT|nr:DUF362 domain-containing protein [Oceanidesulfovibrio marinus]TVM34194.1 hypothetical protein DQK91_09905 [Oceanidesulfovibrio marinus]
MRRREFLKWQMHGALWLAAGSTVAAPLSAMAQDAVASADELDVAIAKGAPAAATRAAVELLGGMQSVVKPGQKVAIKPNMSFPQAPDKGTTTHPEVVSALVAMCREAGAEEIFVLDHPLSRAEACLERSEIQAACSAIPNTRVLGLEDSTFYVEAPIDQGEEMRDNAFMREVLEADVLIAAPVAKSHGSTGVSLSMKGMMGLIWDRGVMHYRYNLDQAIVDLNTKLAADLAVVDATRVLSTNGPYGPGRVLNENTVIASRNVVAADAMTVSRFEWYGRRIRPDQVGHIRAAHDRGLGPMDVASMKVREVEV